MTHAVHVSAKDDPFIVRRDGAVGFNAALAGDVVVLRHVDEALVLDLGCLSLAGLGFTYFAAFCCKVIVGVGWL